MTKIIELAHMLGEQIAQSDEIKNLEASQNAYQSDSQLQAWLSEHEADRKLLADEFSKPQDEIDEKAIAKRPDHKAMERAILAGDLGGIAENLCNVFDPIVTEEHLELNYIKSIFNSYGAVGYQMTGSGSAVFAIVDSFEFAAVICNMLRDNYPSVFIAKPI